MNPGMISLASLGLGQCVAPPTCIAGQSLFTVPGAVATNNANSNMTDANCPTYQCLPSMTASPVLCTSAECVQNMAQLNSGQPVTNSSFTETVLTSPPFLFGIALLVGGGLLLWMMSGGKL
jgi:hypothetical protein